LQRSNNLLILFTRAGYSYKKSKGGTKDGIKGGKGGGGGATAESLDPCTPSNTPPQQKNRQASTKSWGEGELKEKGRVRLAFVTPVSLNATCTGVRKETQAVGD